jgi:hypothetical protein
MKKNVKNKILAFSMASAMIVPNAAVVFAEAPKAGLATVAKKASETKTIYVSYLEGAEWKASEQVEVSVDATAINTSLLKNVPAGYETCETGDLPLNGSDCININIRKKTTKTIYVSYIDEETSLPFANGIEQVEVAADATTFNTSALKNVPEGYALCETGDQYFGERDTINIKVRKKAEEKKTINVTYFYVGENGENIPCGTDSVTLDASATTFNNTTLTNVPEGYGICRTGDVYVGNIADGEFVYIEVREKAAQTRNVRVHYVSESGEMIEDNIEELTIPADQTTVKTTDLKKIPAGYEVCAVGDINFSGVEDVNVEVRKKAAQTRTVYVHYIDAETKIPFENAIEKIEIPADEIHVNTSDLKEIPAGYEPVVTGDLDFYNTDDVNVELRKIEKVTTLHITFETVDGTVVGEKTFEKTSTDEEEVVFTLGDDIVLPEGYHFVNNGQIDYRKIKAGQTGATVMFVEQDETKAVLTVTFETKDGETVGTTSVAKEFTVDENGDKVTTFILGEDFTLPEGYHLADDVDQVTEITMAGTVGGHTVVVEKDAVAPTPTEDPKKDDTKKDDTKKEETKKPSKTADTADTSDVAAYAIPLVMSMVAISAIVVGRKKLS